MATTLLVGISRQTPVEKYLDNADDKRLLNLICKLEGWHGAERKEGLCNPPSRAVGKMKRGAFKFTACSRYLMVGERGEGEEEVWKRPRVFCQFAVGVHRVKCSQIFVASYLFLRNSNYRLCKGRVCFTAIAEQSDDWLIIFWTCAARIYRYKEGRDLNIGFLFCLFREGF